MTLYERFGTRDLTYSAWHRPNKISRYVDMATASKLTYIDLDGIEVCQTCYQPLCLIELAQDIGQAFKQTKIMVELAKRADVRAMLVFYRNDGSGDIARFRLRQVWPPDNQEYIWTPKQYADWLVHLRTIHTCETKSQVAA